MSEKVTIVSHRERDPDELGFSVTFGSGPNDGEQLRMVECVFSDGAKHWLFASNVRPGYFKQVFVPWDFQNPAIIDNPI